MKNDRIVIFDTTLRDGEQSPGASMLYSEKVEIGEVLDAIGVDVIEAGFPTRKGTDFDAIREIATRAKRATICALARATKEEIDLAAQAVQPAGRKRIHTFIAVSPDHMRYKLRMRPEEVIERVRWSVRYARNFTDDVEWSGEDATQSSRDFLCQCIEVAIDAGATTVNIPDTVGRSEPEEYGALIAYVRANVPNSDKAHFSVHCHNDLGMALANSFAGIRAGARQIECTVNGIGERAGNAALEEIVMAIKTRGDRFPFEVGIDTTQLVAISERVEAATFAMARNKAVVGKNAFAHESGIHQDGMLKHGLYEIMRPESVGRKRSEIILGKHSGRNALAYKLDELGYPKISDSELNDLMVRIKAFAEMHKHVSDDDLRRLFFQKIPPGPF